MTLPIPAHLRATCRTQSEWTAWLERLPSTVNLLLNRWSLTLGPVYATDATCAWVAAVISTEHGPSVLKLGMPHMEARDEAAGLRFWNGNGIARLLAADDGLGAMLLERCEPGFSLGSQPEPVQSQVIAGLLQRLWRKPPAPNPFRPLSALMEYWSAETNEDAAKWPDAGLVREGLQLFAELPQSAPDQVLLATDLHAGNVLAAQREPWLAIDPKPFVGDPAYDLTQHLLNCEASLSQNAGQTIDQFADLANIDRLRVRQWVFARLAAEPRADWRPNDLTTVAKSLRI